MHSKDDNFFVTCDMNGYSKCASFVSHVYRQHRDIMVRQTNPSALVSSESNCDDRREDRGGDGCEFGHFVDHMYENFERPRTDLQHTIDQILQLDDEEQRKKGALYILKKSVAFHSLPLIM